MLLPAGTPDEVMNHPESLTGQYLSGKLEIAVPKKASHAEKKTGLSVWKTPQAIICRMFR
jgi:excinuclease ABC subunit A